MSCCLLSAVRLKNEGNKEAPKTVLAEMTSNGIKKLVMLHKRHVEWAKSGVIVEHKKTSSSLVFLTNGIY